MRGGGYLFLYGNGFLFWILGEDFTLKDVYDLKVMLHAIEKELDSIVINKSEGIAKPGVYVFHNLLYSFPWFIH